MKQATRSKGRTTFVCLHLLSVHFLHALFSAQWRTRERKQVKFISFTCDEEYRQCCSLDPHCGTRNAHSLYLEFVIPLQSVKYHGKLVKYIVQHLYLFLFVTKSNKIEFIRTYSPTFYRRETLCFTQKEGQKFTAFQNRVLMRAIGSNRGEVAGACEICVTESLQISQ